MNTILFTITNNNETFGYVKDNDSRGAWICIESNVPGKKFTYAPIILGSVLTKRAKAMGASPDIFKAPEKKPVSKVRTRSRASKKETLGVKLF